MPHEVEINGVTYESKPELRRGSCEGCVAKENESLCSDIFDGEGCHYSGGIVWIKKEKPMKTTEQTEELKYTVEEVLGAVEQVMDEYFTDSQVKWINSILTKQNNPEYKLYLELKAKFAE